MSTYYAILTAVGEAKLANAAALGTQIQIRRMAVGDGNGNLPNPNRTQTALVREQYRADLNTLDVDRANSSQIIAELVIPEATGGWWIREMGLYDADGDMIAVSNCPPSYKPQMSEGSGRTQVLRMVLVVSSTAAVSLKVDPSIVLSTRAYAESLIVVHQERPNPHSQYLLRSAVAADAGPLAWLGDATGTANGLTFTLVSEEARVTAYTAGQRFQFKAKSANTGPATAKLGSLPAVAIKKASDAGLVDLAAGDIKPGAVYDLIYDGSTFQLGGGVGAAKAFERYSFTASVGQAEFTARHTPGSVIVLRNGREITGFASSADGSKIVLAVGCNLDDSVEVLAFNSFKVADGYTKAEVDALWQTATALPVGAMLPFVADIVPPGFVKVAHQVLSKAAYPDLYAHIGDRYNDGTEPTGFFRMPESRGEFLRGWDDGRGVDAGRTLGSYQADALQNITGTLAARPLPNNSAIGAIAAASGAFGLSSGTGTASASALSTAGSGSTDVITFDISKVARTSTETRSRNLAVQWCMKAWNAPVNQGQIDIAALAYLAALASESQQGTTKVATDAQMLTDDDTVVVTPKKLRKGFRFSLTSNGYIALPTWLGGLIIQWGISAQTSATADVSTTFAIGFPSRVTYFGLFPGTTETMLVANAAGISSNGFSYSIRNQQGARLSSMGGYYLAFGF